MKRRVIIWITIISLMSAFSVFALSAEYWASKNSDKYHFPTCKWAQKIAPTNLVKFKSTQDAMKAGFKPCKVCKPPSTDKP